MLLDEALRIQAREEYNQLVIVMAPHISKSDRKRLLESYRRMIDGDREVSDDIIKRDRERLRKLLSPNVWRNKAHKSGQSSMKAG